jgi:8-oxo-dGTP pyrophosphatase MutT (NUDIX family)
VLLDGSNNVFLIKHRSGEWTPPGGKIEKNENSLEAAKREYQEETGVSIDALLSKGILESIGIFLFFHPESVRKSAKKERKQVSRKKIKNSSGSDFMFGCFLGPVGSSVFSFVVHD